MKVPAVMLAPIDRCLAHAVTRFHVHRKCSFAPRLTAVRAGQTCWAACVSTCDRDVGEWARTVQVRLCAVRLAGQSGDDGQERPPRALHRYRRSSVSRTISAGALARRGNQFPTPRLTNSADAPRRYSPLQERNLSGPTPKRSFSM